MRLLYIIMIFFCYFNSFSQITDTVYTANEIIIQTKNKAGILDGTYKVFDENFEILIEGKYSAGFREGRWYFYTRPECYECKDQEEKKHIENYALRASIKYKKNIKDGECWYQLGEFDYENKFKVKHDVCYGFFNNNLPNGEWSLHDIFEENAIYGKQIAWLKYSEGKKTGTWKINQDLAYKGYVLPFENILDSIEIKIETADGSFSQGYFINGKKTGTWKYFTSGGNFTKEETYVNGKLIDKKSIATTSVVLNDVSLNNIKFLDISSDSSYLLLATSDLGGNSKFWIYSTKDGKMVRKGEIKLQHINSICFSGESNDIICLYDYQEDISYQFNLITRMVDDKKKGSCEKFYDLFYTLKNDLKNIGLNSLNALQIQKPVWSTFKEVYQFNDYLAILTGSDSTDDLNRIRINLANGRVEYQKSEGKKDFSARVENDLNNIYCGNEGTLKRKNITDHSESDFSFNGAYVKCIKNGEKIYDLDELTEDIGEYLDTWSFFLPGKSEKKHFHFAYKNRVSYTDKRESLGHIYFWNSTIQDRIKRNVRLNITQNGKYLFYTPDMYYFGSARLNDLIYFEQNFKLFPFEQFDLKYNRPDIVLQRLGYADSSTIALYHTAYLKRLKKMGFTEDMLKEDFHLPEINIKNFEHLPSILDSAGLELDLDIKDSKYKLDRINIFINDVPVYGSAGIDLRKENTQSVQKKISLQLSEGQNKIQVSVLNQAGAESYKETAYVTYKPNQIKKPDLYLVTIGDSKYSDARYDLTYAAKDAEDIKKTFEGNSSYSNVFAYSYTNEKVTRENILKLKDELKKAKRDDVVIITVAGHGVLDKNLDYYLATYDMDFNNPSGKGIPYEELESLVDGIAPLKKVIFLDACHSGEVDKEEVEQLAVNTTGSGNVKFRAAGAGIQKKNLGLKTTSELMSELFTDLRKGTGATVISSAGGAEYAMESDQWKNGLFTYCLLHGLKDKAADANGDGQIMLSELQNYLRKEVTTLSNGAQQPTSRIENLTMDFRVW